RTTQATATSRNRLITLFYPKGVVLGLAGFSQVGTRRCGHGCPATAPPTPPRTVPRPPLGRRGPGRGAGRGQRFGGRPPRHRTRGGRRAPQPAAGRRHRGRRPAPAGGAVAGPRRLPRRWRRRLRRGPYRRGTGGPGP